MPSFLPSHHTLAATVQECTAPIDVGQIGNRIMEQAAGRKERDCGCSGLILENSTDKFFWLRISFSPDCHLRCRLPLAGVVLAVEFQVE